MRSGHTEANRHEYHQQECHHQFFRREVCQWLQRVTLDEDLAFDPAFLDDSFRDCLSHTPRSVVEFTAPGLKQAIDKICRTLALHLIHERQTHCAGLENNDISQIEQLIRNGQMICRQLQSHYPVEHHEASLDGTAILNLFHDLTHTPIIILKLVSLEIQAPVHRIYEASPPGSHMWSVAAHLLHFISTYYPSRQEHASALFTPGAT